jgi:hypothetical protein
MKWLCAFVICLSIQLCEAKETLFSNPANLLSSELDSLADTKINSSAYTKLKQGLSRELMTSVKEKLHLDVAVMRPSYDGLTRSNFSTINNPLLHEGNAIIRLSVTKSF